MPTSVSNKPRCHLICVGSELLRGKLNTHAVSLARRLVAIGLELNEEHTVGDERLDLVWAIRDALERADVIFVTGGLGPTFDDLTREAASDATGRLLRESKALLKIIQKKFKRAHYRMPPANARQALLLEGAEAIANSVGTAPGQWCTVHGPQILVLLPGPPSELLPMLDRFVIPRLKRIFPALPTAEAHLHFVGIPESRVDHMIRPIIRREQAKRKGRVRFTILAHLGLVDVDIYVTAPRLPDAQRICARIATAMRRPFPVQFYGMDSDYPLEKVVGEKLRQRNFSLAVAESCTGGMLATKLTDLAGSSDYFAGGVVAYSNAVKMSALGVPEEILQRHGAVSRETALAMARGVRERFGSTWGVSITGIAGPSGGTAKKPVGLVYIGLASTRGAKAFRFHFGGDRAAVRQRTVTAALDLLRNAF